MADPDAPDGALTGPDPDAPDRAVTGSDPGGRGRALTVAVVGAGVMGRGIAQLFAGGGDRVLLTDADPAAVPAAIAAIGAVLDRSVERGRLDRAAAAATMARLAAVPGPGWLAEADLVVEAVVEDAAVKAGLLAELDAELPAGALLVTNTSALSVTALQAGLTHRERFAGLHFFNPAPLMRVVEVVAGEATSVDTLARLAGLVRRVGHQPVIVRDSPGFLINHAGRAYGTEALRLADEGIAAPVDIDRLCREAGGFPLGPFELLDLTGLDVTRPVMDAIYHGFYEEPRLRPSATLRRREAAGLLGRKSGVGFYGYPDGRRAEPAEQPPPAYRGEPVWTIDRVLADRLTGAGVRVVDESGDGSACLLAPWGRDVTTEALERGIPPDRAVGVDPLPGYHRRATLAATPATDPAAVTAAHAALARTGPPVTVIADSPGLVLQRIVAMVVNTGCELAQLGVAAPGDIDLGVRLGLGYPEGPLAWGDRIGPARILAVLEELQRGYGDPRYRPSIWLTRRARLGLSLAAPARR